MNIRKAENKDIPSVLALLSQVLSVHAEIRPDLFKAGTTKYTEEELESLFQDAETPVFVAEEQEKVLGYAFCQVRQQPETHNFFPYRYVYVDDICVDAAARGKGVATALFQYVKSFAKDLGCKEVTLNVWEGNTAAQNFYRKMGMQPKKAEMEYIL